MSDRAAVARKRRRYVREHWRDKDVDIARHLGVSRERVRQYRKTLGLPPLHVWRRQFITDHLGMTNAELAKHTGLGIAQVGVIRRSITGSVRAHQHQCMRDAFTDMPTRSVANVARICDVAEDTVRKYRQQLGIPNPRRTYDGFRRWTGNEDAYVIEHQHETAREIGLVLNRSTTAIAQRKHRLRREGRIA